MLTSVRVPLDRPLTFADFRDLNPEATPDELAEAFDRLPHPGLREQCWEEVRLRVELDRWGMEPEGT